MAHQAPRSWLLTSLTALSLWLAAEPARAQCRTQCAVDEALDASGCCAPIPSVRADTAPTEEPDWSAQFQAYHLTSPFRTPWMVEFPEAEARGARLWQQLMALDARILAEGTRCNARAPSERPSCAARFAPLRAERLQLLDEAMPVWRDLGARPVPWRAQTHFMIAIGQLLAGDHKQGFAQLRALTEGAPESPYTPYALATMADYFFARGAFDLALPLYLRAGQSGAPGLETYALWMRGWTQAALGQPIAAITAMVRAHKMLSVPEITRRAQNLPELRRAIEESIATLYASVGEPERARDFATTQLGLTQPEARSRWLEAVARELTWAGRPEGAATVRAQIPPK